MGEDPWGTVVAAAHAPRVLITGGASGIGRAAAQVLASRGSTVVVVDVDDVGGRSLEREAREAGRAITYLRADVASATEMASAAARAHQTFGGIDALIAAAGIMRGQLLPIEDVDEATWQQVIDVNLRGAFLAVRAVAPVMLEAGRGVIVLIGSKAGVSVGSGSYAYGASKGGIHGLALALDRHLGPAGVRVHEVCPGDVDTPLIRGSIEEGLRHGGDPDAARRLIGALASPRDVAEVLAFLVSDAAAAVRGTVFTA